jgi:HSP20 family protein
MTKKESKSVMTHEPAKSVAPLETRGRWFDEMERWFENEFRRPFSLMRSLGMPGFRATGFEEITPSVDVFEEGDELVVKAELPGMKREDIDVSVTDNTVLISGEKRQEEKVEKKNFYRMERSYGSFTRSFTLPSEVETDRAKASFKEGVLEIRIPKSEEAKRKEKKVTID